MLNDNLLRELQSFILGGSNDLDLLSVGKCLEEIGSIKEFKSMFGNIIYTNILGRYMICCKNCNEQLYKFIKDCGFKIFPNPKGEFVSFKETNLLPFEFFKVVEFLNNVNGGCSESFYCLSYLKEYEEVLPFKVSEFLSSELKVLDPKYYYGFLSALPLDVFIGLVVSYYRGVCGIDYGEDEEFITFLLFGLYNAKGFNITCKDSLDIPVFEKALKKVINDNISDIIEYKSKSSISDRIYLIKLYVKSQGDNCFKNLKPDTLFEFLLCGLIDKDKYIDHIRNIVSKDILDDCYDMKFCLQTLLLYTSLSNKSEISYICTELRDCIFDLDLKFHNTKIVESVVIENDREELNKLAVKCISDVINDSSFGDVFSDYDESVLEDLKSSLLEL